MLRYKCFVLCQARIILRLLDGTMVILLGGYSLQDICDLGHTFYTIARLACLTHK